MNEGESNDINQHKDEAYSEFEELICYVLLLVDSQLNGCKWYLWNVLHGDIKREFFLEN